MNKNIDRSQQPPVTIPASIDVQMADMGTLPNGARLYTLECSEKDVVRFSFVFKAGTSWQDIPFSASATLNTLSEGSSSMTSQQIAEHLDFYGSYYDVNIDRDWAIVTFVCLSKFFDQTLAIAREILLDPVFPEHEVRVYCDKSRQNLTINRTKSDFNARELFAKSLYGESHPYGHSSDAALYDNLTGANLREFYKKHYTGKNCFVVVSGNTSEDIKRGVSAIAGELPEGVENGRKKFPQPHSEHSAFKPMPGSVQSAIRIGKVLFNRSHPDFVGMQVLTTVLGGYFGSRLVHNLREEHGYTYGAYSAMVNFDQSGYMAIATEVGKEVTEDAVAQIFYEIQRLRTEQVGEQELALVKNIMVGEIMRILDGPFGIADVTIENVQNGVGNSYVEELLDKIRNTTAPRLMELAQKYMQQDSFTTVIVGDKNVD